MTTPTTSTPPVSPFLGPWKVGTANSVLFPDRFFVTRRRRFPPLCASFPHVGFGPVLSQRLPVTTDLIALQHTLLLSFNWRHKLVSVQERLKLFSLKTLRNLSR